MKISCESVIAYCRENSRVCPMPMEWNEMECGICCQVDSKLAVDGKVALPISIAAAQQI